MARKKSGKHSKTPAATSATARRSSIAFGAATAVVGASLALGVTPAFAQTGTAAAPAQPAGSAAQPTANNNQKPADNKKAAGKQADKKQVETKDNKKQNAQAAETERGGVSSTKPAAGSSAAGSKGSVTPAPKAVQGTDKGANERAATPAPEPQANPEITLSKETKDTLPNMYAWGSTDNTYIDNGQNTSVKITLKSADGIAVTKVAIFPNDNIDINGRNAKDFVEYKTGDDKAHQPYSGEYGFATNTDGSATLTVNKLYRNNNMPAAGYAANRCIYVYGMKDGQEVLLYKTNIVRAATLVPPKKTGSIVLRYDQKLEEKTIREKLQQALDAPTAGKDGKSLNDQIKDASKAKGVGVRTEESQPVVQKEDVPSNKILVTDNQAYDGNQVNSINTPTAKQGETVTAYKTGVYNLKTYLVSDLGYKSDALPLTIARYDTRIDKPTVEDLSKVSDEVKTDIKKKLARLNHVSEDKVSINDKGEFTINFDGVDAKDAPTIALRDLVLKKIAEDQITVPAADKAVYVANPLGYSSAEIDRIKTAIFEANKDNQELGLTSKDQITLEYLKGDLTATGDSNKGISNGQAENKITVKIKTDKSVAEFTSNVKEGKLTKLPDIRKDYDVSWTKTKIDGRETDEGISWSNDQKTTIIYRYDPTKAEEFDTTKILGLLKATPKDKQAGLRDLTGGETLGYEGTGNNGRKSHMHYALQNGEPTGELTLGNMSGAYWQGSQKVSNSDVNLGDNLSDAGSYSWDKEAGSVTVAGKKGKIYKARLFVQPYAMTYYKDVYLEKGSNPGNTAKAINVIFVPQTNHKTKDLSDSIGEHKLADDNKTPTEAKYYNASADKKEAYEKALDTAKKLYNSVKDTDESKLTEDQKAQIDNATINLNKARAELDGPDTNKDKLNASIEANGKAAEGTNPASGTQATNQFKNVSDPDFKTPDGKPDTKKNEDAKKAKTDYDKALEEANKVKEDKNATQKAVDAAKAKLDAARAKLNDFTTSKDELNNAIAQHGTVNTGDATKTDPAEKLKTADPTYQNSTKEERDAYDKAVAEAKQVVADPNASQKEVNEAIKKLKDAKEALDKNATDKAPLDAAVQKSFDNPDPNDANKQSVFYKNAAAKKDTDPDAKKAVEDYDNALKKAKDVLADKNATKKDVEDAKKALEDAEAALHADKYQTKATDLAEAIADNFSGYLMPAYFNAFDKAQAGDEQAKKDFKAYNDAYHAAKDLLTEIKKPNSTVTQEQADAVKKQLLDARKIIDTYATDTSRLSAAVFNDIAIKNSPAYKNLKALAEKTNPTPEEQADVEAAKKAMEAYKKAAEKLHNAITNQLPRDKADGQDIPDSNIPKKGGNLNDKDYLKDIQAHKNGEPLNRDVDSILQEMNEAAKALDKFKTNTDDLIKSINEDATTHPSPAFKNASQPNYQKPDGSGPDDTKNAAARKAASDYGQALNTAKDLLNDPNATQAQIDEAKKNLDNARKALDAYNTDTTKLEKSVGEHGKDAEGTNPAVEGTKDSDAYRNASDPHFVDETGKPDEVKNQQAREAKTAYDKALADAQELIAKHNDANTPQDAKPTQAEIDAALAKLDEARKTLVGDEGALDKPGFGTKTTDLDAEIAKSSAADATDPTPGTVEDLTTYKNALAKKTEDGKENPDITKYKEALKKARELAEKQKSAKASERPLQKDVDEAYRALLDAKKIIADGYKTDATALQDEAALGADDGNFTKSPEYKNADAKKADDGGDNDELKAYKAALTEVKTMLNNFGKDGKPNAGVGDQDLPTQAQVDAALKKLSEARKAVEAKYKTNVTPLSNEVGDKDEHGKDVTPPFEASVPYKNALAKANAGDNDATTKLKNYADKLAEAQKLIEKVKNPDPNAKPEDRPTQKQVDDALAALKQAKKDIDDNFKTKVDKLQNEVDDKNEDGSARTPEFEKSTEFANLQGKTKDGKKPDDLVAYEQALAKAKELIDKNDGKVTKDGQEVDVPKDQLPTQQEVDEAQKALKEIKDKILANYKTNPHDLQEEVDQSKVDDKDKRDTTFENTPEYQNAQAKGDEAAKKALDAYTEKLKAAKKLLDAFDRTTGKPKTKLPEGMDKAPTQKELDDALDALQAAKKKITDGYKTDTDGLKGDYDNRNKEQTSDYTMASKDKQKAYSDALNHASDVLNNPNATQAEVDAAQAALKKALEELEKSANANRRAIYEDMVIDARNALQKLVDANEATHLKDLYTHAEPAAQHEFMAAMDNAKKVLADKEALASELDAARVRLLRALDGLAKHQLPGMTNAGANGNAGTGANGAAGYGAHAAGAYGRGAHAAGRVRAHAGKHLAQTSDPTNALAAAGMLASALGFIAMGFKTKKRRAK